MNANSEAAAVSYGMPTLSLAVDPQKLALTAARLQAHAFKAAMRYQLEALAFLRHRCEMDVKLADDLVASDELNDAFDICTMFMQTAATEYAAEAGRFASISSRIASDAARRVRKETQEAVEDFVAATTA